MPLISIMPIQDRSLYIYFIDMKEDCMYFISKFKNSGGFLMKKIVLLIISFLLLLSSGSAFADAYVASGASSSSSGSDMNVIFGFAGGASTIVNPDYIDEYKGGVTGELTLKAFYSAFGIGCGFYHGQEDFEGTTYDSSAKGNVSYDGLYLDFMLRIPSRRVVPYIALSIGKIEAEYDWEEGGKSDKQKENTLGAALGLIALTKANISFGAEARYLTGQKDDDGIDGNLARINLFLGVGF